MSMSKSRTKRAGLPSASMRATILVVRAPRERPDRLICGAPLAGPVLVDGSRAGGPGDGSSIKSIQSPARRPTYRSANCSTYVVYQAVLALNRWDHWSRYGQRYST